MYEEKDFLIRQIELLAKGLGKFMGLEQIKELIGIDQDQLGLVTDEELKSIIASAKFEVIMENKTMSIEAAAKDTGISKKRLSKILNNEATALKEELVRMNEFIEQNLEFL